MVITKLSGGLGNQLFQYACGRAVALKLNTKLKFDISWFEEYSERDLNITKFESIEFEKATSEEIMNFYPYNHKSFIEKAFYKVSGRFVSFQLPYVRERFFHFDDEILKISGDLYLDGYWQSEKYFTEISDLLKKELILNITGTSEEEALINQIRNTSDTVALHVRRGDYKHLSRHAISPISYYEDAIAYIKSKIKTPQFIIFSDDELWIRDTFSNLENSIIFHSNNLIDFNTMSLCNHQIIANSTFSWWSAWLNKNDDKIIVSPKKWHNSRKYSSKDLLPQNWKVL